MYFMPNITLLNSLRVATVAVVQIQLTGFDDYGEESCCNHWQS
jgi:hypothetical protein